MRHFQASVHFKVLVLPYMHYAEWFILLLQSFQHNGALLERHDSGGSLVSMTLKLPAVYHQECFKDHTIKWITPCLQGKYWLQNFFLVCVRYVSVSRLSWYTLVVSPKLGWKRSVSQLHYAVFLLGMMFYQALPGRIMSRGISLAKVWSSLGVGKGYCRTMHAP